MIIDKNDIVCYSFTDGSGHTEYVCPECITSDDDITSENIMTQRQVELLNDQEKQIFCDRCKKEIT